MNYACGALWGAWVLFWLAFARGNTRTATPVALLTRQFPDAYPLYQRRVKAIIPFLY